MTNYDLHLEYKRKTGFYPVDSQGGKYQHRKTNEWQRMKYIEWLEEKLLSIFNQPIAESGSSTCHLCLDNETCEFAFDPYNKDGDCLAAK